MLQAGLSYFYDGSSASLRRGGVANRKMGHADAEGGSSGREGMASHTSGKRSMMPHPLISSSSRSFFFRFLVLPFAFDGEGGCGPFTTGGGAGAPWQFDEQASHFVLFGLVFAFRPPFLPSFPPLRFPPFDLRSLSLTCLCTEASRRGLAPTPPASPGVARWDRLDPCEATCLACFFVCEAAGLTCFLVEAAGLSCFLSQASTHARPRNIHSEASGLARCVWEGRDWGGAGMGWGGVEFLGT